MFLDFLEDFAADGCGHFSSGSDDVWWLILLNVDATRRALSKGIQKDLWSV